MECVKECPSSLYSKLPTEIGEKRRVTFEDPYNRCSFCGHCVAICPTDAILFEDAEKAYEFEEAKKPSSILDYDTLLKIVRARRSIRRFKPEPVPKEEIIAVLEAMRYAPSASNAQSWEFIVVTDQNKIDGIRNIVISMMSLLMKVLRFRELLKPFVSRHIKKVLMDPANKAALDNFFQTIKEGDDPVFYNAPVVIITYAPMLGNMAGVDAGIVLTHGMLAAIARDLGTCWIGYAQEALRRSKKARKWLNIPKEMNVNGVLIMGYPAMKYYRSPPRNPLKIKWY